MQNNTDKNLEQNELKDTESSNDEIEAKEVNKLDRPKNRVGKKVVTATILLIPVLIVALALSTFFTKKIDINIDIVDTNSSISTEIDKFLEENKEISGVHSIREGEYTYVLIVSEKKKTTEMSINLYELYKKGFNINIEYEIEVNENSISADNPERVQKMLIRFKESGKIKPIVTKISE